MPETSMVAKDATNNNVPFQQGSKPGTGERASASVPVDFDGVASVGSPSDAAAAADGTGAVTVIGGLRRMIQNGFALLRGEDTAHVSGDIGVMALAVRRDANTPLATPDGDYTALQVNEEGRLKVAAIPGLYELVTGAITANGQTIACNVARSSNIMLHIVATSLVGHNCTFEGSIDSTDGSDGNWFVIQAVRTNANTIETATGTLAATPTYGWELSVNGLAFARVRATGHTSGTATWKFQRAPYATEPIPAVQVSATQPVSISSTPTNGASIQGQVGSGVTAAGNPVYVGLVGKTAQPSARVDGQVAPQLWDKVGRAIVVANQVRDLRTQETMAVIAGTTETTIAAAGGTNNFKDVEALLIECGATFTGSPTSARLDIRDASAGTVRFAIELPLTPGPMPPVTLPAPFKQATANNAWTAQLVFTGGTSPAVGAGSIRVTAQTVTNL